MNTQNDSHRADQKSRLDPSVKPVLTVEEVADLLHIGRSTAYKAVRRGQLPSVRIGRRVLVPTSGLLQFLQDGADPVLRVTKPSSCV